MPTIAKTASGTLLKVGDGQPSPEGFTTVPECKRISGPSVNFDLMEATSHDLGGGNFREYIPGLADGDSISVTMNWRPSNTVHKTLRIDSYARTLRNFRLVYPDTSDNTATCATYVQNIVPKADIGTILEADMTLKITGAPVWS